MTISYTQFTSDDGLTAKSYHLQDDVLTKGTLVPFSRGTFETVTIDHTDLKDAIEAMATGQFLIQGIHPDQQAGRCPEDARRLKETFAFREQAGLLCIDTDAADLLGIDSFDSLRQALIELEPALAEVMMVMTSSASSYLAVDGNAITGRN